MNPYIIDDDREIDLLDLVKYLLHRIVWILLVGVACAGLLCAFKYRSMKTAMSDSGAVAKAETEYEEDLEKYERESELIATSNKNTKDLVRTQEEYLRTSPLMQMDPYHVWKTRTMVRVESVSKGNTPFFFENLYRMELKQSEAVEKLADELGTERAYVSELFSIDSIDIQQMYLENVSAEAYKEPLESMTVQRGEDDTDKRYFFITVFGSTREDAQSLMDLLLKELDKIHDKYAEEYPHEIKSYTTSCVQTVDTGIRSKQKDTLTHTQSLLYQMKDNVDKGTALLTKPAQSTQTSGSVSKRSLLKYGLIGFIIGFFIMCVFFIVRYNMNNKLIDFKDTGRKGFILRDLGCITDQGVSMAAANIRNFAKGKKSLFLTGMAKEPEFEDACGSLKEYLSEFEIIYSRDVVHDPKSREKLLNCDAAVLVEQKGVTCYPEMEDEVTFVVNAGKDIVGIVIV